MVETTLTVLLIVIVVSMGVAIVIRGLTSLLGRQPRPKPAPAPAPAPAAAAGGRGTTSGALTEGGHPPAHVAAIVAAVAAVFDDSAVIVHIQPTRGGVGWASEGRAAHHGSHNIGRSLR